MYIHPKYNHAPVGGLTDRLQPRQVEPWGLDCVVAVDVADGAGQEVHPRPGDEVGHLFGLRFGVR